MKTIKTTTGMLITVSDIDATWAENHNWTAKPSGNNWYAVRDVKGKSSFMHTEILKRAGKWISGEECDHRNGNTCDNTRGNLRSCTRSQNLSNRAKFSSKDGKPCHSIYKGVTWCTISEKFKAQIVKDKQIHYLGLFDNQIEAAIAYNKSAKKLHGTFALLNSQPEVINLESQLNNITEQLGTSYINNLRTELEAL